MLRLRLTLLGGIRCGRASGPAIPLPGKKAQGLLAYLALRPGQAHPRDKLAALLWGDVSDERARHSLRQTLMVLRQALPRTRPPYLLEEGETVALNPAAVEVDVEAFERLVAEGTPEALEQALAHYRGDLLEGLGFVGAPFEEWLGAERQRLRELALEALAKLLGHQTKIGAVDRGVQTAVRLLALDPLQEPVHRALMRLHARQGRRGFALKQYQVCVDVLQRELGVAPEPETKQLYQEILQSRLRPHPVVEAASIRVSEPELSDALPSHLGTLAAQTPLIGRDTEVARLRQAREQAWHGHGQLAVILGEAGIGKSRLVAELVVDALHHGARVLVGRAYEAEQFIPFGPWVDALRTGQVTAEIEGQENLSATWRAELRRLFPELGAPEPRIPMAAEDYPRIFEALVQLLGCLTARQPLLLVLEDLHWADDMSLRLLCFLSHRVRAWPALVLGTVREEELPGAPALRQILTEPDSQRGLMQLRLLSLSRSETVSLVQALSRAGTDEAAVTRLGEQIWMASQGNPFVVVETMRALQEGGTPETRAGLPLPRRVRDVLAARLDRLSDRGRQLGAVAAVIGREFDFVLLQRAAGFEPHEAADAVEELVGRRILHVVGERLDFTHDRIRQVAYDRLLPPRRKLLHGQVAETLEVLYRENLEPEQPELLAHHYTAAGLSQRAIVHWQRAGQRAIQQSAYAEAITHLTRGLELLETIRDASERAPHELALRLALGAALIPTVGYAAPDVENAYARARELCGQMGKAPQLFPAMYGLFQFSLVRGELQTASALAEQLLRLAQNAQDPELFLGGHLASGIASVWSGNLGPAREHLEQGVALYDPVHQRSFTPLSGSNPRVMCEAHASLAYWCLGYPDKALATVQDALAWAHALPHLHSLALAGIFAAALHGFRGEIQASREHAEETVAVSTEHGFPFWATLGTLFRGWAVAAMERWEGGIGEMQKALAAYRAMGAEATLPYLLGLLAEAYANVGQADQGLSVLPEAIAVANKNGEHFYEPELYRLKGDLLLMGCAPADQQAEGCFRQAIEIARGQRAKSLELRARVSLTRLLERRGKRDDRRLLAEIYGWFTEGFDTRDLKEAKTLLERLS
ncbi:MAG: AAA family ATPase [Candidatus Rokubacteria bacterium]|nr:AAA family ATPase [Candidatus Rokubacteria bacterium]